MVKHIILWKLKEYPPEETAQIKRNIREHLQSLVGKIDGLTALTVHIQGLPTSTADVMLDSTFESAAALNGYAVHPEHVRVANEFVRPYTQTRSCLDFEI